MKKLLLLCALCAMFILASCGSPLDSFMKEIDAGNYSAAVTIYEEDILGNPTRNKKR